MNRRRLLQSTAILALVTLCAPALAQTLHGTLYKDQDCPCCEGHAKYLVRRGIDINIKPVEDIAAISKGAGIPGDFQGCHTLMLEGYAIEGHVHVEIIHKLLKSDPPTLWDFASRYADRRSRHGWPYEGPYKVYAIKKTAPHPSLPINKFRSGRGASGLRLPAAVACRRCRSPPP